MILLYSIGLDVHKDTVAILPSFGILHRVRLRLDYRTALRFGIFILLGFRCAKGVSLNLELTTTITNRIK
ncbi:MAG: hypothetical protein ACJAR1_002765 [Rubritalea sp.]|jgi:hypothetical protein